MISATGPSTATKIAAVAGGALAGLAAWALGDPLASMGVSPRLHLALALPVAVFFAAALPALGPLSAPRAAVLGAGLAVPLTVLTLLASFRFDDAIAFVESAHALMAVLVVVVIAVPILIAALRPGQHWRRYDDLFGNAWDIVLRCALAVAFAGLGWLVLFLGDTLLDLVGIDAIARLFDDDPQRFTLTGLLIGLALAALAETGLGKGQAQVLRLLRLLVPVVMAVTAVFLVAFPLQGLSSEAFGVLSEAGTLMAMAFAAALLVTATAGADDDRAARSATLRWCAAVLALLLPALSGLALVAVGLRVGQYGWTPDRLAAASIAVVLAGHGVVYAVAVLRGAGWMARLRQGNVAMAGVTVLVALAWLTPVLDPQRISASSQERRFARGAVSVEALDLAAMARDWGRSGDAAAERLATGDTPEAAALRERLDAIGSGRRDAPRLGTPRGRVDLAETLPTVGGAPVTSEMLGALNEWLLGQIADGCARATGEGRPGCLVIRAELLEAGAGDEAVIAYHDDTDTPRLIVLAERDGQWTSNAALEIDGAAPDIDTLAADPPGGAAAPLRMLPLGQGGLVVLP
ncbi:DUF4153 domain-containing protein [Tranquillimonas rosea]|uniref:DUF4153 domain-containing protein n=1 Tax=Tranquillimonas rosea TaxID=641238 RepID=UPI003BA94D73